MNAKLIIFSSMASLVTITSANAADYIVSPEPESVQYVRVCDAYGAGYFYIPGTETCLRIHGYVRADLKGGDNVYGRTRHNVPGFTNNSRDTYNFLSRFTLRFSTTSETELGTLRTYAETRFQYENGADSKSSGSLRFGYIQLGGLRIGLDESAFTTFTGYAGSVINDDVIMFGGYRTNAISYTFTGGNGFSAIIALEQGGNGDIDAGKYTLNGRAYTIDGRIDNYTPHVVAGLRYEQGWGALSTVAAYDSKNEKWAGKVRLDVNATDQLSLWVMGGYKSNKDRYLATELNSDGSFYRGIRLRDSFYGTWGGDWAVWGGAKFKATDKASFNVQLAYEDAKTLAATANIAYEMVPGFTVTPEVSYTKWNDKLSDLKGKSAWQGMVRFQRSF
ncbi:porin [Brucella pseudogrignonensis]|uniref:porin n=1 Tax=Brucella pseudogrignonensis TaxID=419475 RepID=UPI003D9876BC